MLHTLQVLYMCTLCIPELKVGIRTAIETINTDKQFEMNSIIVLMFVESQRVHI